MQVIQTVVLIIALLIIYYFQNRKIGSLETQIKSQKEILENANTFMSLIDLEKLKGYADLREEQAKTEKDLEIKKIRADLDERLKKEEDIKKSVGILLDEYYGILDGFFSAFYKLPYTLRREVVSSMREGVLKKHLEENLRGRSLAELLVVAGKKSKVNPLTH